MPSSPTSSNGFNLQATGENLNTWGAILNAQTLQLIDSSLDGITQLNLSTSGNTTLSSTNYVANQARQHILEHSGTMTGSNTLVIPNVTKWYHCVGYTVSGGYPLTIKTATGVSAVLPASGYMLVYCDGTDTRALRVTDMGGYQLRNAAAPTLSSDVATQGYVLARAISDFSTPTTNVSWGGYRLTNLGDPVASSDAANMGWTLSSVSSYNASAIISANSAASSAASALQSQVSAGLSATSAGLSAAAAAASMAGKFGYWAGSAGGTAAAITLTTSPAIASYFSGLTIGFVTASTLSANATVTVSGLSTINLATVTGAALVGTETTSNGMYFITVDNSTTSARLQGGVGGSTGTNTAAVEAYISAFA